MINIDQLKFDKDGLIVAVVQHHYTKEVLTVAYMNKQSLQISMAEQKTCFYSRSRQCLWRKGQTSGNYQHIVSIKTDCDLDALTITVIPDGPACHKGTVSCFVDYVYNNENIKDFSLEQLFEMLKQRKEQPKQGSYTTYLFEKGLDKILKKVGEECTEVIIGAKGGNKEETIYEIADLTYHVYVLMLQMGITQQDIFEELSKRHIIDNKIKQESFK